MPLFERPLPPPCDQCGAPGTIMCEQCGWMVCYAHLAPTCPECALVAREER